MRWQVGLLDAPAVRTALVDTLTYPDPSARALFDAQARADKCVDTFFAVALDPFVTQGCCRAWANAQNCDYDMQLITD